MKREYIDVVDPSNYLARCADAMEQALAARGALPAVPGGGTPTARSQLDRAAILLQRAELLRVDAPGFEKLGDDCLHALAHSLDSRSEFLARAEYRELQVGAMGGIGVELAISGSYPKIVSTIENAPAARSDLRAGDLLLSIDGTSVRGMQLRSVVMLLKGAPGSKVVLLLSRQGEPVPLRREFTRKIVRFIPVRAKTLDGGVLYVRVVRFVSSTLWRFVDATVTQSDLHSRDLSGMILDLRGNPGGLFDSCISIATALLPPGSPIVETRGRTASSNHRYVAGGDADQEEERLLERLPREIQTLPLVVLVDHGSAACSEILAAALQDDRRAKVVGEKTFGYGIVQTILPFEGNTAFKLTTGRFYRPGGGSMASDPVVPDVAIDVPRESRDFDALDDLAITAARRVLDEERSR